ncbi:MAG: hypothetical protein ABI679_09795 [Gemmatimonadota bacterium]
MREFTILVTLACVLIRSAWPQAEDTARVELRSPLENPRLTESSALVRSRTQAGVLWTLNDSGNPAELFAIDTLGHNLGVFGIEGADNRDWESLGYAQCGARMCLYIGDTGDNLARYPAVNIYRVPEPVVRRGTAGGMVRPTGVLTAIYPDGPRDVEAMFLSSVGDLYLISKGRSHGVRLYRIPAKTWSTPTARATAEEIGELPIPAKNGGYWHVTDASISDDGERVAVRTYGFIYFFRLEGTHLIPDPDRKTCVASMDIQGEGIAWLPGGRLATTSEQAAMMGKSISIVKCR